LRRNPNYHGGPPHRLAEIVDAIGSDPSRAVAEVEAGKADYASVDIPAGVAPRLAAEHGLGSKAAKAGHQQYFVSAASGARYLHMNASRPLFADARLRRAVSYAVDRRALVAQEQRFPLSVFSGGPPTGDYLPPTVAGARDFHLYQLSPDLRQARRLAGHVHATAVLYAATSPPWPHEAQVIRRDLKPLGIDVQVKEFPLTDTGYSAGSRSSSSATRRPRPRSRPARARTSSLPASGARCTSPSPAWTSQPSACGGDRPP
jgi:ABC-type transport system substrate-binding protein